jgi:hypothetical protein
MALRLAQTWLWAVGDNPLSHTSHGTRFNMFQRDVVMRNYIAHALDTSIERSNQAYNELLQVKTSMTAHHRATAAELLNIESAC